MLAYICNYKKVLLGVSHPGGGDCKDTSVKITVKFIQIYNNTFAIYHALINLKGGLIQTPPKSHFMQSTHKMWP